jgi:RNA polymerase sigma factor FliA
MNARANAKTHPRLSFVLHRVRRMAQAIARGVPSSVDVDDLVAAGNLGVAATLARFSGDPSNFEGLAMARARGAMLDELRGLDTMSRPGRRLARRAAVTRRALTGKLGRLPTDEEVAAEMELDLETYRDVMRRCSVAVVESTNLEVVRDDAMPADEQLDERRAKVRLSTAIALLPSRHATVIELSFQQERTLQSIAEVLGVSTARAHQIRDAALEKLRLGCAGGHLDAA